VKATRLKFPRERSADRKHRALRIVQRLAETYPDAACALHHRNPWELLVATILSAQCTDAMVNEVTPALFERYADAASLAEAPQRRVEKLVHRTGFFTMKARALRECAKGVVERFGGEVPKDFDALVSLRGVGRKTASVVVGTAFGQPAVFVDTHVKRLAYRLGLTSNEEPDRIQEDLKALLPKEEWTAFCHRLINHGRTICKARAPRCEICPLLDLCPRLGVKEDLTRAVRTRQTI
jgi:endonuclease-3